MLTWTGRIQLDSFRDHLRHSVPLWSLPKCPLSSYWSQRRLWMTLKLVLSYIITVCYVKDKEKGISTWECCLRVVKLINAHLKEGFKTRIANSKREYLLLKSDLSFVLRLIFWTFLGSLSRPCHATEETILRCLKFELHHIGHLPKSLVLYSSPRRLFPRKHLEDQVKKSHEQNLRKPELVNVIASTCGKDKLLFLSK